MINSAYLLFVLFHTCLGSIKHVPGNDAETTGGSNADALEHKPFFCNPAPPEGSVYARFNQLVTEYFFENFGAPGTAYLKSLGDCPGDKIEQITSVALRDAIIAEMSDVVESYGIWEDVGVINIVKRITRREIRDIRQPRFRVHRLVALILHSSQNPTSGVPSVEKIKYENAVPVSDDRSQQDNLLSWIKLKVVSNSTGSVTGADKQGSREIREKLIVAALKLIGNTFTLGSNLQTSFALLLAGDTVVIHDIVCHVRPTPDDDFTRFLYASACVHIPKLFLTDCTTNMEEIRDRLNRIHLLFTVKSFTTLDKQLVAIEMKREWENEQAIVTASKTGCTIEGGVPSQELKKDVDKIYDQIIEFVFDPQCTSYCDHALTNNLQSPQCLFPTNRQRQGKLQKLITLFRNFECTDYTGESFREKLGEISRLECPAKTLTHD